LANVAKIIIRKPDLQRRDSAIGEKLAYAGPDNDLAAPMPAVTNASDDRPKGGPPSQRQSLTAQKLHLLS
jgi:hypothetical protein